MSLDREEGRYHPEPGIGSDSGIRAYRAPMTQPPSSQPAVNHPPRNRGREALNRLMSRQSAWPLTEPPPTSQEMRRILGAALCAPDHGQLRPWRFVVIRGEARAALGEVFVAAAHARDPGNNPERFRSKAFGAPVVIALVASVRNNHKVPIQEQILSAAAGVMNVLNALHLLGYGGFWATGRNSHDALVHEALGLGDAEHLLGFLYIGTPRHATRVVARSAPRGFVREWTGPTRPMPGPGRPRFESTSPPDYRHS